MSERIRLHAVREPSWRTNCNRWIEFRELPKFWWRGCIPWPGIGSRFIYRDVQWKELRWLLTDWPVFFAREDACVHRVRTWYDRYFISVPGRWFWAGAEKREMWKHTYVRGKKFYVLIPPAASNWLLRGNLGAGVTSNLFSQGDHCNRATYTRGFEWIR
jgi:hypothetical protein